ncbi:hypothetical protein CC86DRAFT_444633 [Ophiobolus disseminans]|uniref:Uncharacterized protein n=1 Tax=Ophiobolus disseminans TaxID=1469910 RepID=A0A6A7A6H7_9PLEO|nr:hypothetical protein CC86DRAFT_444633 [Ophiobolus disseminans]
MVHNSDLTREKIPIDAILVADLTPAQLDTVQEKFGNGAILCNPFLAEQLFIHDKREWSSCSLADLKRKMPDTCPLLVVDLHTPNDGAVWYIEDFANQQDVDGGIVENTNTLFKICMKLEDVVISYMNFEVASTSTDENLSQIGIFCPILEEFTQDKLYTLGFDCYLNPTWVTTSLDEIEEGTELDTLMNLLPLPTKVYRLKEDVARSNGLKST